MHSIEKSRRRLLLRVASAGVCWFAFVQTLIFVIAVAAVKRAPPWHQYGALLCSIRDNFFVYELGCLAFSLAFARLNWRATVFVWFLTQLLLWEIVTTLAMWPAPPMRGD
jgi:hypothetical protein